MTGHRLQEVKNLVKSRPCPAIPHCWQLYQVLIQVHFISSSYHFRTLYFRIFNQITRSCRIAKTVAYILVYWCPVRYSIPFICRMQYLFGGSFSIGNTGKVANMQLFINLLVVQYGSSQSVSYSKRGQACILEIALKNDGGKKKSLKTLT